MTTQTITDLAHIERLTKTYAAERRILADRLQRLEDDKTALQRRLLPGIKSAVAKADEAKSALAEAIEDNPGLFKRPRTVTIEGIKVGIAKGKGKAEIHDEAVTVRLIRRHIPDQADTLIRVKESVVKSAVANLTAAEAKRIGVTISDTGDQVVIRAVGDDIDKLVAKLLETEDTTS